MSQQNIRREVMKTLEQNINAFVEKFLIPPEKIWQPTISYLILKVIVF